VIRLIIAFTLILQPKIAQDTLLNFRITEEGISWEKVYNTNLEIETVTKHLLASGVFKQYEIVAGSIVGTTKRFIPDYVGAGYKISRIPNWISRSYFQGEVIIDFKEGRYKVIVKRITKDVIDYDDFRAFEDTAMDGPRFSKIFKTHPCAEILQFTLDNFFVVKVKKDDW
jgi:hypothetical protein